MRDSGDKYGGGRINNFFSNVRTTDEPHGGRVYAAYEVPALTDDAMVFGDIPAEPVFLECIDTQWFHQVQTSPENGWLEVYANAPLSVLELTRYPLPDLPSEASPGDIVWFEFGYSPASNAESDAITYTNLYSTGSAVKIAFHEPRPLNWIKSGPMGTNGWIVASPAYSKDANNYRAITNLLSRTKGDGGIAIYDVGQGSCQAILDEEGLPSLYVDFDGGVLGNLNTFPKEYKNFCFSNNPGIILSHWDWDHWSSAYRFHGALNAEWIAPPVPQKPIQQAFAAHLFSLGKLHIWDEAPPYDIQLGCVRIERCTGKTVNDSGISVTITNTRRNINFLLPGDADYKHIPSVNDGVSFSGVCITHHGGKLRSKVIPKAAYKSHSFCSVGSGNSYKHPFSQTIDAHINEGWMSPIPTGLIGRRPSHIWVPWNDEPRPYIGACKGEICNIVPPMA